MCVRVHMCVCVCVCVCVCTCACVGVYLRVYVCVCACTCACVSTCVCVCVSVLDLQGVYDVITVGARCCFSEEQLAHLQHGQLQDERMLALLTCLIRFYIPCCLAQNYGF